jgi:hypothetical protein
VRDGVGPADYVTGERLQALAGVVITTAVDHAYNPRLGEHVPPEREFYLDRPDWELAAVLRPRSVFVYTHLLDEFAEKAWGRLRARAEEPLTLISHNSDGAVTEEHRHFLEADELGRWFAANAEIEHPKLQPLPLGLANSQWPHGALDTLDAARRQTQQRKRDLLYVNFSASTHAARAGVRATLEQHGFRAAESTSFASYLEECGAHRFTACPRGNGPDTHRTWEALYLGSIPVVDVPIAARLGVPCVVVRDWSDVTPDFLADQAVDGAAALPDVLTMAYWRRAIAAAGTRREPARA